MQVLVLTYTPSIRKLYAELDAIAESDSFLFPCKDNNIALYGGLGAGIMYAVHRLYCIVYTASLTMSEGTVQRPQYNITADLTLWV